VIISILFLSARAIGGVTLEGLEEGLMSQVKGCTERNELVVKAFRELGLSKGVLCGSEWSEEDGVVPFNGKIYVPLDGRLLHDIVHQHQDTTIAGHPGHWKTLELISRNFWWPGCCVMWLTTSRAMTAAIELRSFPPLLPES
jgi:hypothetical protein